MKDVNIKNKHTIFIARARGLAWLEHHADNPFRFKHEKALTEKDLKRGGREFNKLFGKMRGQN